MPDFETAHFLNGFPTPTGKFQFKPDWAKLGPATTRACRSCPTTSRSSTRRRPSSPFRLVAAPARNFLNTTFTETPTSQPQARGGRPC